MAIQFARCHYVSRKKGGNACRKSAYNARTQVRCERIAETFSFEGRGGSVFHQVLLPEGTDKKFSDMHVLWNGAEFAEKRKDAQVAKEIVLALPDNQELSLEDRVELSKRFAQTYFVSKGVAVQIDIHAPHDETDKNWHAHLLITTRRFDKTGLNFASKKARDLDPEVRWGKVTEGDLWGELWRDLQNGYFKEKGLDIRVDAPGIVGQEHLGPVRMRKVLSEAVARAEELKEANKELASDPPTILSALTTRQAVITPKDVQRFIDKHTSLEAQSGLVEAVLSQEGVCALYNKDTGEIAGYTTREIRAEEERLMRFAKRLNDHPREGLSDDITKQILSTVSLSEEQRAVFDAATGGSESHPGARQGGGWQKPCA